MIPAVRGTRDILPSEVERWQRVETVARDICARYGYAEIRTPVIEREELFKKSTGEATDIVQKEMYAFTDKGGEKITLRPEATPSMVRAFVEHNIEQAMPIAKLYLLGPMFRYERPQKGRYRQFYQLDVEAFGIGDPAIDAEIMEMAWALLTHLDIRGGELVINSVGCPVCRPTFTAALINALGQDLPNLCADCRRRATINPLRVFDCKVPADQAAIDALPHTVDFLCEACRQHFEAVQRYLTGYLLPFRVSHRLVRGLDYYTRTTFEVLAAGLGAQNALLGGGRYDGLVRQLGGPDREGIGFAAGLERLVLALPPDAVEPKRPDAFVAAIGDEACAEALRIARALRQAGLSVQGGYESKSIKSQLKRADRLHAARVVIVGGDELARGEVTVKDMKTGEQIAVGRDRLVAALTPETRVEPETRG